MHVNEVIWHIFPAGAESSDEGAKIGFQGTINAKNLWKSRSSPSDGGVSMFRWGYIPLALPQRHPCIESLTSMLYNKEGYA